MIAKSGKKEVVDEFEFAYQAQKWGKPAYLELKEMDDKVRSKL